MYKNKKKSQLSFSPLDGAKCSLSGEASRHCKDYGWVRQIRQKKKKRERNHYIYCNAEHISSLRQHILCQHYIPKVSANFQPPIRVWLKISLMILYCAQLFWMLSKKQKQNSKQRMISKLFVWNYRPWSEAAARRAHISSSLRRTGCCSFLNRQCSVRLWEIYPFICCGHAQMHPTTHHFYFIPLVSHSAGWLNRIMSLTIIINQNYGPKKLEAEEIAYQDVMQEQDPQKK